MAMENPHLMWEIHWNTSSNGPFSINMLVYRSVVVSPFFSDCTGVCDEHEICKLVPIKNTAKNILKAVKTVFEDSLWKKMTTKSTVRTKQKSRRNTTWPNKNKFKSFPTDPLKTPNPSNQRLYERLPFIFTGMSILHSEWNISPLL